MNKGFIFSAALLITVALSACGMSTSGEAAQIISGQVPSYGGPAATLEAVDDIGGADFGEGSIEADGSFSLSLEARVSQSALRPIDSLKACDNIRISDSDARTAGLGQIRVTRVNGINNSTVGALVLTRSERSAGNTTTTAVGRVYVDRNVSVSGQCRPENSDTRLEFSLDLRAGWNIVTFETRSSGFPLTSSVTYRTGLAPEAEWTYIPYN